MNIECYHNIHKDQAVKGFLDYQYCSELEEVVQYNVYEVLEDNQVINTNYTGENEIDYLCIYAHGSRVFGNSRKNSDIDFVLFYKGSIREDDLFNIFVDESIFIEHIKCDFNPIRIDDDSDIEYYIQKHDVEYYQKPLSEKLYNLRFALDDFEPEEIQVSKPKQQTISKEDSLWQNLKLREYVVDLGLPSGTLWCKYNLGCGFEKLNNNLKGTTPKDWEGDYYAWGELEANKKYFHWDTYKYAEDGFYNHLTKYCNNKTYGHNGFTDNLTELQIEDDAAYQKIDLYGYKFHIPTKKQWDELLEYTKYRDVGKYNKVSGLNGYEFISKINGNKLFIPAAGFCNKDSIYNPEQGWYWSSTVYENNDTQYGAYCLFFEKKCTVGMSKRADGLSIRPVINL